MFELPASLLIVKEAEGFEESFGKGVNVGSVEGLPEGGIVGIIEGNDDATRDGYDDEMDEGACEISTKELLDGCCDGC